MKLYFYRARAPNFGDELNTWLMPKVFPDFFDEDERTLFLGIGSVISNLHEMSSNKIVFGSGYAGYTRLPVFDEKWKFYCVRGPRTAKVCGLGNEKVAGDSALMIRNYRSTAQQKTIACSFIPHWESLERGHWEAACRVADIHFLDPRLPVEMVLSEIESSQVVITEAMHGAIVADALRVPWIPMLPIRASHRWKWFDWAESLDLNLRPHFLFPSSTREVWTLLSQREGSRLNNLGPPFNQIIGFLDKGLARAAAIGLRRAAALEPMLSSDSALARALEKLYSNAERIKADFSHHLR